MNTDVEEIKSRLSLVDLISEYIPLKKAGSNFKGVCPFHSEHTPSFMVTDEKGIWHCFGCGEGGDAFGFVMKIEGMDFPEALNFLAKRAGVTLHRQAIQGSGKRSRLLEINEEAATFFQRALQENKAAQDYLEKRGLTSLTLDQFRLGAARDSWDALLNFLRGKKYKDQDILEAGLIIRREKGDGYYDRFRNRIMFPLRDVHGQVVGFTARQLDAADKGAKYINTPETEIYHKGKILYGLDQAKVSIKKLGYAILVEGQMDCISSHQAGVTNVLATSGTALTIEQLQLLKRYTTNLILAFDMDNAGQEAVRRGIELAMAQGMSLRVATEMAGKDPDAIIKEDPKAWRKALKDSVSIMEYYFQTAMKDSDPARVEDKKKITRLILPQLARLQDQVELEHYLKKLSDIVQVDPAILRKVMDDARLKKTRFSPTEAKPVPQKPLPQKPTLLTREQRFLSLIVQHPKYIDDMLDLLKVADFEDQTSRDLYKAIETFYNNSRAFELKEFIAELEKQQPDLSRLLEVWFLALDHDISQFEAFQADAEIQFSLRKVREDQLRRRLLRVEKDLRTAETLNDAKKIEELTFEFQTILDQLQKATRNR